MTDFVCTWWEYTGDYSPFVGAISSPIMRNTVTGELKPSCDLPVGSLYAMQRRAGIGPNEYPRVGADGLAVGCVTIGGHIWDIDGRASNCRMPNDNEHRCWVRHGTVGGKLTVDKDGDTCAAGAGSFFMDDMRWHGFLRDGKLVQG